LALTSNANYDWPNPQQVVWYIEWSRGAIQVSPPDLPLGTNTPRAPHLSNPRENYRLDETQTQGLGLPLKYTLKPSKSDWSYPDRVNWYVEGSSSLVLRFPVTAVNLPPGKVYTDVPTSILWYQDWSQNLASKTPVPGKKYTDRPDSVDWRISWVQSFTALQLTKPFKQTDWPLPLPINWYSSWEQQGFKTVVQNPFGQYTWSNPSPITFYRSWEQQGIRTVVAVQKPFSQLDWPNPTPYLAIRQTWSQSLASSLPASSFKVSSNYWSQSEGQYWDIFWSQSRVNLLPLSGKPFSQYSWPNPEREEARTNTWIQTLVPVSPSSIFKGSESYWSVSEPPGPLYPLHVRTYSVSTTPSNLPFSQNNWPVPSRHQPIEQTWIQSRVIYLPLSTFKVSENYWAPSDGLYWDIFGSQSLVLKLPSPSVIRPINQQDWPLPGRHPRIEQTWLQNLVINSPVQLFLAQPSRWDPLQEQQWYREWYQSLALRLLPTGPAPFKQQDWPLSVPVIWDKASNRFQDLSLRYPTPTPIIDLHFKHFFTNMGRMGNLGGLS